MAMSGRLCLGILIDIAAHSTKKPCGHGNQQPSAGLQLSVLQNQICKEGNNPKVLRDKHAPKKVAAFLEAKCWAATQCYVKSST